MVPNSGHPITVESWDAPLDGQDGYVRLLHQDWPGVRFVLTFDAEVTTTGFMVLPDAAATPLSAKRFQRIPYGALVRAALEHASTWSATYSKGRSADVAENPYLDGLGSGLHRLSRAFVDKQYPGRRGRSEAEYAAFAARYAALARTSTTPVKDLAEELKAETGEHLSIARVRNIIWECRERCLLTKPAKAGVGGGELTKKARARLGQTTGDE